MSASTIRHFRELSARRGIAPPELAAAAEPTERFTPDELVRMARERLRQFSHTPPSGLRYAGSMSTPDLIYYLAKHIERQLDGDAA